MDQLKLLEFPKIKDFTAYRLEVVRKPEQGVKVKGSNSPEEVADYLFSLGLAEESQEMFLVLHINTKNLIIGHSVIAKGIIDRCHVHPREVFQPAILNGGTAKIILVHNHPSGDVLASRQDRTITDKLVQSGEILGIDVVDHLIVAYDLKKQERSYLSFRQEGFMKGLSKVA